MAKKKTSPELLNDESQQENIEFSSVPEEVTEDLPAAAEELTAQESAEFADEEPVIENEVPEDPAVPLPEELSKQDTVEQPLMMDSAQDYDALLLAMEEGGMTEEVPVPISDTKVEVDADATFVTDSTDSDGPQSEPQKAASNYTSNHDRVLTIDAREELQSEKEREATLWHEIQNAYRTHRMLTGTLDGVERMESGLRLAVVNYKGFRVAIPITEMMLESGSPRSEIYTDAELGRILNSRLGGEIDFLVKGIENKSRSIVASRKDAMLKKRRTFYLDADENGQPMIYEGRIVQARVVATAEKMIRVEVFGVECSIRAKALSWEWVGDAREMFSIGDRVLVRVLTIDKSDAEHLSITADIRSVYASSRSNDLSKCRVQSMYAARVTDLHNGVIYVRLNNGVSGIAHSCYDRRMPGKNDDVSFVVTRLDEESGYAVGIITRIIKQNL